MIKNRNQVSKTSDNLAGLHLSPLKRHCSYNLNGSIIKKRRSTKSAFGYVAPYNADVAFKSSRNGEQTLGEKVPSVGLIDDPLNWTVNKVAESESAGGAR